MYKKYSKERLIRILKGQELPSKFDLLIFKWFFSTKSDETHIDFAIRGLLDKSHEDINDFISVIQSDTYPVNTRFSVIRSLRNFDDVSVLEFLSEIEKSENYDLKRAALYTVLDYLKDEFSSKAKLEDILDVIQKFVVGGDLDGLDYLLTAKSLQNINHEKVDQILRSYPAFNGEELGFTELEVVLSKRSIPLKRRQID